MVMFELETEIQEIEPKETTKTNQTKNESKSNSISITDLVATLKNIKNEEKQLLSQRKELEATENDLRNQAIEEIENKKRTISGLKTQIAFQQNKCSELEQALGI
jgi:predicted transcriptional regulator